MSSQLLMLNSLSAWALAVMIGGPAMAQTPATPNTVFILFRTGGHHGKGEIEKLMGPVSGYVIDYGGYRLYIAGDTIWCDEVAKAIKEFQPTHIVLNGGGARFTSGDPIIMDIDDVLSVCHHAPNTDVMSSTSRA